MVSCCLKFKSGMLQVCCVNVLLLLLFCCSTAGASLTQDIRKFFQAAGVKPGT
jgi:hypothetical protein